MKIIIASSNRHKISEYRQLFAGTSIEIVSMGDEGLAEEIDEVGVTYEENATIKAEAIASKTRCPVLADDSGLEIAALDGFPGLFSARFATEQGGNDRANATILAMLAGHSDRRARFIAVISLSNVTDKTLLFRGECPGHILNNVQGQNGFGYDPIFFSEEANSSFACLEGEVKNHYSHRGKAVAALISYLQENRLI